jgi:hypothetical protein
MEQADVSRPQGIQKQAPPHVRGQRFPAAAAVSMGPVAKVEAGFGMRGSEPE